MHYLYPFKPHWCIYYWIKSMNKSHKVGRVHGWILYCGLIMPLLVAFLVDFVILEVIWVNMMSLSLRLVAVLILFVRARLWSFVPSSFPWALKILLYIIKSWNFQDLSDFAAAKAVNAFCIAWLNILYIFQKKWSMIKLLKLLKPFFLDPWTAPKSSKLWQKNAFPAKQ